MAKSSINNIQAPAEQAQPNALQQMGQQPQTQVNPIVQTPMAATATQASPMKALVPQSLTSLTSQPQAAQPTALGQMTAAKPSTTSASNKMVGTIASGTQQQSPVDTSGSSPNVLGKAAANAQQALTAQGPTATTQYTSMATGTTPMGPSSSIADFAKNVGGQYAGTPWSNALQASLNQYSQVWEQTKQQLGQQYRDNNLSAATNAASSGYSPFGAASADLSRQAASNNYKALNDAASNFGTGLTNIMGQYGQNALQSQQTDVNNQSALDRMNLQNTFNQQQLAQELAAQPQAPGLSGDQQTSLNDLLSKPAGAGYSINMGAGNSAGQTGATIKYIDGQSYTVPSSMLQGIGKTFDIASDTALGKANSDLVKYYGAYSRVNNGHPPTYDEVINYLYSIGYQKRH